jgi:predicted negative regulator of RcsB-dependent stress response
MLSGDLDWIVMKALEKDRTRRFETANGLALDVQRYLNDEPVEARPPSKLYRFQKLARRNRTTFAAIGAGVAALVAGLALSLYLFMQEKTARQRAVAAEIEQARMRQQAERNAEVGVKLGQAGMLLTRNQFDEAERLISDIPPHSSMVPFFSVFGQIHSRRGHWQAAITNYAHAVEFMPADHLLYHCLAPLFLQVGDVEGYQHHRQRMLRQFSQTSDPVVAERIAKDCLILPPATSELAAITKMTGTAIAANPASAYFEFVKGFAEYRQGQWAAAADQMQQVVSKPGDRYRTGEAWIVLAMAQ